MSCARRRFSASHKAILGSSAAALVGMENVSCSDPATNRGQLASGWLSPLLEIALPGLSGRWPKAGGQGNSGADLSYGGGEPDLGSTAYSRRVAEAGVPCIGAHGLTLAPASAQSSRSCPALADVPVESS